MIELDCPRCDGKGWTYRLVNSKHYKYDQKPCHECDSRGFIFGTEDDL